MTVDAGSARRFPRPDSSASGIPAWAEQLVLFLDDGFVIPGTSFRVGFDAIIGLIPGLGDLVTTTASLSLVTLAHRRGLPKTVLARMLFNLGIDALFGAIPVLGDVFDVTYKANRRNLTLLQRHHHAARSAETYDRVFLVLAIAGAIAIVTLPVVLAIYCVRLILG